MEPLDFGVEEISGPVLILLEASDSPLLGVGDGSLLRAASDFLEVRGLEVVLRDVWMERDGFCFMASPPAISPSDFRLLALVTGISVDSSLLCVLLGLDFELDI